MKAKVWKGTPGKVVVKFVDGKLVAPMVGGPIVPVPVRTDNRTCFGLAWYATEADAVAAGKRNVLAGLTVNGGWLHGMPCDRAPGFDYVTADGVALFATRE